jgi:YesN/AraC family two-component response regulator
MYESGVKFDRIDHSFSIWQHRYAGSSSMSANHYHNAYEIYYMLEGERYYFIKDRTYHVMKGDIVLIGMDELHKTVHTGAPGAERILINFKDEYLCHILSISKDMDLLSCFSQNQYVLRLNRTEQKFVENLLQKILEENKNEAKGFDTYSKILLAELLLFLNRSIEHPRISQFEHPSSLHKKISEIVVYLNSHYNEEITLDLISRHFYISPYYFSRLFKEVTGFSFVEYLNSVRIREAQKMLLESCCKISDIADKTGFDSSTHFGRVFKAITGLSPLQYRKKQRRD